MYLLVKKKNITIYNTVWIKCYMFCTISRVKFQIDCTIASLVMKYAYYVYVSDSGHNYEKSVNKIDI